MSCVNGPQGPGNSRRPSQACGFGPLQDADRKLFLGGFRSAGKALEGDGKDKSGQVRHQPDGAEQEVEAVRVLLLSLRELKTGSAG